MAGDDALPPVGAVVRLVVRPPRATGAGPPRRRADARRARRRRRADPMVGAARPFRSARHHRPRPARCGVDVVGVRQHVVHADGQLRRRRLRRQRHRCRHRRLDRAGRDPARAAGRRPRRPHRPPARRHGDGHRCTARDGCRRAGAELPVPRRHPGDRPPDGPGTRLPRRRRGGGGDAPQQPGLRRQHPGDGQRARSRRRGDRPAPGRHLAELVALRVRRVPDLARRGR